MADLGRAQMGSRANGGWGITAMSRHMFSLSFCVAFGTHGPQPALASPWPSLVEVGRRCPKLEVVKIRALGAHVAAIFRIWATKSGGGAHPSRT